MKKSYFSIALGMIHIWCPWKLSNFQDPLSLVHLRPNFVHPLWPWTPNFKRPSPSLPQTMEEKPDRTYEGTKSKQKYNLVTSHANWPRVLLFHFAYKQCSDTEPVGRFLVNNILMFDSAWCLVMAQIQFYLIKNK